MFRYKRLMFGISCAPEIFQKIMEQILAGCRNVINYIDDIIIFGASSKDHDENLRAVLQVLKNRDIELNAGKCEFKVKKIMFLGHYLSNVGVSADPGKVHALETFRAPTSKEELKSFLGLANYIGKFIPDLSTQTDQLRQLTKEKVAYVWTETHEKAFRKVKKSLANPTTLGYFDPKKRTRVIADASPVA